MIVLAWLWFVVVQLLMLVATVLGWIVLIPLCLAQSWVIDDAKSLRNGALIDEWKWGPLNYVYGNPEDGVSGMRALIWNHDGTNRTLYMPNAWAPWRAYCWSAWRNSADNLKYVFAWKNGPLVKFGTKHKIGWQEENGHKVPVIS